MIRPNRRVRSFARALVALCAATPAWAFVDAEPPLPPVPADALVPVCIDAHRRLCGLIDLDGRWAAQSGQEVFAYANGAWIARHNGWAARLLDVRGQRVARLRSNTRLEPFSEGLAAFERRKHGYLNLRGEVVVPERYDIARPFSEGLAAVGHFIADGDRSHYEMGYIDATGREAIPLAYRSALGFRHGLGVVELADGRVGAIDARGRMAVPPAQRDELAVVAPDRLLAQRREGPATLIDGRGRVLFRAARILHAGEGLAFFSKEDGGDDDTHLGLLDLRSGKPVRQALPAPPGSTWTVLHPFSEGLAWVRVAGEGREDLLRLIDRQGRTLFERTGWQWAEPFVDGAAAVTLEGRAMLVDRHGERLGPHEFAGAGLSVWSERRSSVRLFQLRDIAAGQGAGDMQAWVDAQGRVRLVLARLACGIEQLRDGAGKPLWPVDDVAERCVLAAESRKAAPDARDLQAADPARLAALREREPFQLGPEATLRVAAGLPFAFFPLQRDGAYMDERPGWQDGPLSIRLPGGPATLALPAGYRYLPPEAIAALRREDEAVLQRAGRKTASAQEKEADAPPPWGVIAPSPDAEWAARVLVAETGHIEAPPPGALDATALADTIRHYAAGSPLKTLSRGAQYTLVTWLVEPQWEPQTRRLLWAMDKSVFGTEAGSVPGGVTLVQAGRTRSIVFNVAGRYMTKPQAEGIAQRLAELADAAHFDAGEAHADFKPSAGRAELRSAASLVTGHKPAELRQFEQQVGDMLARDEAQRRDRISGLLWQLVPLGLAAAALLAGGGKAVATRRRRKGRPEPRRPGSSL